MSVALIATFLAAAQARANSNASPAREAARVSVVRSGTVPTQEGLQLTLSATAGSVRIFTDATREVRYRVRLEAPADDPAASVLMKEFSVIARGSARGVTVAQVAPRSAIRDMESLWEFARQGTRDGAWSHIQVEYEVHVPRRYDLEIMTGAGSITTQDIDGLVVLATGGGNIHAGRIGARDATTTIHERNGMIARLETAGGYILAGDTAGTLRASTAGGPISIGDVHGNALLHTGGGHIYLGHVTGESQLTTGGGNIVAERIDGGVMAESAGGRIEVGEAAGMIRMRTGGGGIRIGKLAGPSNLESVDGSVVLMDVEAPLRAVAGTGGITAFFSPEFPDIKSPSGFEPPASMRDTASELVSGDGDIIVYLPRQKPMTINAVIEHGSGHRIVADPPVPLDVTYENFPGGRALRGKCTLNGGGQFVRMRAAAGDVQLRLMDTIVEKRLMQQQSDLASRRHAAQRALVLDLQRQTASATGRESPAYAGAVAGVAGVLGASDAGSAGGLGGLTVELSPATSAASSPASPPPLSTGSTNLWWRGFWRSAVPVAPDEQQRRLMHSEAPVYPEIARDAGIEGDVTLRVVIAADGSVRDVDVLRGQSTLSRAAAEAVGHWRYAPALLDGWPVSVVTTVTIAFRLR